MLAEARRLAAGALPRSCRPSIARWPTLGAAPQRIVHGDSHPGNVLWTAGGPLWSDWEDAHLAPLEWDLACLVAAGRVRGNDFGWAEAALARSWRPVRRGAAGGLRRRAQWRRAAAYSRLREPGAR